MKERAFLHFWMAKKQGGRGGAKINLTEKWDLGRIFWINYVNKDCYFIFCRQKSYGLKSRVVNAILH